MPQTGLGLLPDRHVPNTLYKGLDYYYEQVTVMLLVVFGIPQVLGIAMLSKRFRSCALSTPAVISRPELPVVHKLSAPSFSVLSLSLSYPDTISSKHILMLRLAPESLHLAV